jgi:hypothetical protein
METSPGTRCTSVLGCFDSDAAMCCDVLLLLLLLPADSLDVGAWRAPFGE